MKLVYLIFLQKVADYAHLTGVVQPGAVDQWPASLRLVFKPKVDIMNIRCDYQFAFSVLDELYVSHNA